MSDDILSLSELEALWVNGYRPNQQSYNTMFKSLRAISRHEVIDGQIFHKEILVIDEEGSNLIAGGSFFNAKSITNLIVRKGVSTIEGGAFTNSSLRTIDLQSSIVKLAGSCFSGCAALTSVNLGPDVKLITEAAFDNCGVLDNLDFSQSSDVVLELGAFLNCRGIQSVNFNGVISIDSAAFSQCRGLTTIDLSDTVTFVGNGSFFECDNLTEAIVSASATIEDNAFPETTNIIIV